MPPDDHQQLLVGQTQHLVGGEEPPFALALGLPVLGNHLGHRHGVADGHGGIHLDAHIPAAGGEELRRHLVGAAQHQLDVTVANDLRPQVIGITVLELSQTLHRQHHVDPPAADDREGAGEVRTVRCAAQLANVVELIQDQVHRHRAAHLRGAVGKAHQLDE